MLPFTLHGYCTFVCTSTGETLFSLVYDIEVVLPAEVEIPSLRVIMETKLSEDEWVQNKFDQLNLIEEKRMTALCHGQLYQKRIKKSFDKRSSLMNSEKATSCSGRSYLLTLILGASRLPILKAHMLSTKPY